MVYSRDFILSALQGRIAAEHRERGLNRAWYWQAIVTPLLILMGLAQAGLMLLAWLPVTSSLLETIARVFSRNAAGFFLRACYWKAKLKFLGQDTIIDQSVEIWGPGAVAIGSQCHIDTNVRLAAGERRYSQEGWISIGDYVHLGPGVHISGRGGVKIGDFVGLMANVHIYSATGVPYRPDSPDQLISMTHMAPAHQQNIIEGPIYIDDYACIGMMTRVMPGVRVGRGAIVHGGCELTRAVPPFANYGGVLRSRQIDWRRPVPSQGQPRVSEPLTGYEEIETDSSGIRIREVLDPKDLQTLTQVIDLHRLAFQEGVTTQLGIGFLFHYYKAMIEGSGGTLWVAEKEGKVCGFMGCATDRITFKQAHWAGTDLLILWKIITNQLTFSSVWRAIRKNYKARKFPDRPELLSIVVSPDVRRSGLGRRFLDTWFTHLQRKRLKEFIVFTDNPEGIGFYRKYGGEELFNFPLGSRRSACYRFQIPQKKLRLSPPPQP